MIMRNVQTGDRVRVHYASRSESGGTFETSRHRRPLEFIAGSHEVISGVSRAVVGMSPGESKTITVLPRHGFGERDTSLEVVVPRSLLPAHIEEGDQLTTLVGEEMLDVWLRCFKEDNVILDGNHPLAGEVLVIDLELVDFQPHV